MDRRLFLGGTLAGLVGACSPAAETLSPQSTTIEATTTPPTSSISTTSATEPVSIEPLIAEAVAISGPPFGLGIASGDPTGSAVMLWTRLTGELPDQTPLVWEVATDVDFDDLVATGRTMALAGTGHSVRVDVEGLPPLAQFYYRFRVGHEASPVGKTRTFAATGTAVEAVRFAVSSCQADTDGAYAAHRSIAQADVDAVIWLGDYIYGDSSTLQEYQDTYARYRLDPALQAAHAAHPWIMIWDDHEVQNDFNSTVDSGLRLDALTAFRQNTPCRIPEADGQLMKGYRSFVVGDLCRLMMLDARQYAVPGSLLGAEQMDWLSGELTHDAAWSIVGSPVLASGLATPIDTGEPLLPYTWDGAPGERRLLADMLSNQDGVVLSGDLHCGMVLDLKANPDDMGSQTAAPEFMAPAISSAFPKSYTEFAPYLSLFNHQLQHIDTTNGWLLLEITPDRVVATFQLVADVADPDSAVIAGPSFEVVSGSSTATLLA